MIESHGSSAADIYFLIGFGTSEDFRTNLALSGNSETALLKTLRGTGIKLKEQYRGSWLRELPLYRGRKAKQVQAALSTMEVAKHHKMMIDDLHYVQPRVIVPLDDLALLAVTDRIKAQKKPRGRMSWMDCYRGSVLHASVEVQAGIPHPVRVIPTFGPMDWIIDGQARILSNMDMKRVHEQSQLNGPIREDWEIQIIRSASSLQNYFDQAFAQNPTFMTTDIETWGGLPTCISFCLDGNLGVSAPLWDPGISNYEMCGIWRLIAKALAHPIPKGNQNILYDIGVMERHGFFFENVFWDSMVSTGAYLPEMPKGLDFLTSLHTNIPYYKDEGKEFDVSTTTKRNALMGYNAKDAIANHRVISAQIEDMKETRSYHLMTTELVPTLNIYRRINQTGILVDDEVRKAKLEKYERLYETNLGTLETLCGDKINPMSTKQVGELVYEQLKFPKRQKRDEYGKATWKTDKDTLDDLAMKYGDSNKFGKVGRSIILRIIAARKLRGVQNYLNTPLHQLEEGPVFRCTYNLAGTDTGRSSASKTTDQDFVYDKEVKGEHRLEFKALGRSLQTISKHGFNLDEELYDDFESKAIANDMREIFRPRTGYTFVEGDGSQAEARVVALLAEDYDLLDQFDKKPKIHAKTAAMLFNVPAESIGKDAPFIEGIGMPFYDMGKKARHAGNYDMGGFRLAQMTHLPIDVCEKLMLKFHENEPKLRQNFHRGVRDELFGSKSLRTPLGRYRQFFEELKDKYIKAAYAFIPQSTISDHTKFTMWRIAEEFGGWQGNLVHFLAEMHDGILAEVRNDIVERYLESFKRHYERSIDFRGCSLSREYDLVIPCELSKGMVWTNLEEVKV